ncbi:DUF2252 family protein [Paenibacillus sp. ACRRY]|uniref:DUF2252 family protein n=1 Tax=Paenibacillus sp. ACRRY TaxID=2918208 RepID=UPI001EF5B18F|nr:DUF2252 family protein [Paenibacillus sp. ACRRY]MCG7381921.1 DUF2252 family protein [Paenibacillus sp. ACRRY]
MRKYGQRWLATVLATALVVQALWSLAGGSIAWAASYTTEHLAKNIVISQFYGGKLDDAEDAYSNDFVELHNPTGVPVSLNGWSIQYADSQKNNWKIATLGTINDSIPAYGYYLVSLGSNGNVGAALPQADAEGADIKLSNKSGKVVLLNTTQMLIANDPLADALNVNIVDFVGYGAEAYLGSPAPESGKQSTIQRFVFDPLNPDQQTTAASFPNRGNNWDTRNNGNDFEKVKGAPVRNSGTSAAYAILEQNQVIRMTSESDIDPQFNTIVLTAVGGLLKQGQWSSSDFSVFGLPDGIFAEASASGDQIHLNILGDGSGNVSSDSQMTFEINPSAWDQPNKPFEPVSVYQGTNQVTLVKFTPDNQIVALPDANSAVIRMSGARDLDAQVRISLSTGQPVDGILTPDAYSISGLPSGNWNLTAEGNAEDQSVTISIAGKADTALMDEAKLHIILNSQSVQQGDEWIASEPMEVTLRRYTKPVLTGETRKNTVVQSIIADNTFFNDPLIKEYKYGTEGLAANEYTFLRGTNSLFQADLASGLIASPAEWIEGWNNKDILTYTEGDAHIQNVGTFNDSTHQMVFGLNDFDSAGIGSFYEELLRFVTSVYVVQYDKDSSGIQHLQTSDYRDVSRVFLETYKDTLIAIHNNNNLKNTKLTSSDVTAYTKSVMNSVSKKSYEEALEKLLGKRALDGKLNIAGNPDKFEQPTEAEVTALQAGWEAYKAEVRNNFPNLTDEQFNEYFTMKDAVRRINQGIGSIGVKRYNVLIEGPSDGLADDILLDVKEQTPDASLSKDAYLNMGVDVDAYLGTLAAAQRSYLIREVSPFKGDYTDKPFQSKEELEQYLIDSAKSYAYASSRLDQVSDTLNYKYEDRFVTEIVPMWDALVPVILNAAEDYSQQIVADFALVKEDMRAGKLIDVATLDELTVNRGTITPVFKPEVTQYGVTVEADVASLDLTAKPTDGKATLMINGNFYSNNQPQSILLSSGQNQISIIVTARNGSIQTYHLSVTRGSITTPTTPTPSNPSGGGGGGSSTGNVGNNGNSGNTAGNAMIVPVRGGEFTFQGIRLQVPNGAVQASTELSFTSVSNAAELVRNTAFQFIGEAFRTTSSTFLKPVTLTLPFDNTKVESNQTIGLYSYNEQTKQWMLFNDMTVDRANGIISGTTTTLGTFAILVSGASATADPVPADMFNDINGHWGAANIIELASLGAINGYPDQSFQPDRNVTRAELISMMVKALRLESAEKSDFTDTNAHWAHEAIAVARGLGIANGYGDNTFGPNEWVTREQMASFIVRGAQLDASSHNIDFKDATNISDWARPALAAAIAEGIMNGYMDGTLKPQGKTTRAEAATMILRVIQMLGTK